MHLYQPPLEDYNFILHHFLKIEKEDIEGYKDLSPEFTKPIFEEAGKLASEVISPSNKDGDEQGCKLENGIVRTPDSFKLAFDKLNKASSFLLHLSWHASFSTSYHFYHD